jgi:hypothetical protein
MGSDAHLPEGDLRMALARDRFGDTAYYGFDPERADHERVLGR